MSSRVYEFTLMLPSHPTFSEYTHRSETRDKYAHRSLGGGEGTGGFFPIFDDRGDFRLIPLIYLWSEAKLLMISGRGW